MSCSDGGLTGWAWHPGDPGVDPVLTISRAKGRGQIRVTATDTEARIDDSGLLARPRGFTVPADALKGLPGLLHVRGRDGKDLLGSPLDPRAEFAVPVVAHIATTPRKRPPVDVVVAVHGGMAHTIACLDSVLASLSRPSRLIVVDDASPEPELIAALDALARRRRITPDPQHAEPRICRQRERRPARGGRTRCGAAEQRHAGRRRLAGGTARRRLRRGAISAP